MDSKFEKISAFVNSLEENNLINEEDQSLLLVGGAGARGSANKNCSNSWICNSDSNSGDCSNGAICY